MLYYAIILLFWAMLKPLLDLNQSFAETPGPHPISDWLVGLSSLVAMKGAVI